jgi:hypothetical protein
MQRLVASVVVKVHPAVLSIVRCMKQHGRSRGCLGCEVRPLSIWSTCIVRCGACAGNTSGRMFVGHDAIERYQTLDCVHLESVRRVLAGLQVLQMDFCHLDAEACLFCLSGSFVGVCAFLPLGFWVSKPTLQPLVRN